MELFGSNTPAIVQYLLAFVIVLGVLAVFAAVLRRITGNRLRQGYASSSARHRQQRLGVIDAVDIDAHRQLLLLRRDNVEHLVLIGGPNDLLVESGIGRLPYRAPMPAQQPALPEAHGLETARLDPPAPQTGTAGAAAVVAGAAAAVGSAADPFAPRTVQPPPPPPVPPRSLATPTAPKAGAADAGIFTAEPGAIVDAPEGVAAPAAARSIPEPPPAREREPAKGPFSAVARQLEEALKRPFAAVRPAPVTGINLEDDAPAAAREPAGGETLAGDFPTKESQLKDSPLKDLPFKDFPFKDLPAAELSAAERQGRELPERRPAATEAPVREPATREPAAGKPAGAAPAKGPAVSGTAASGRADGGPAVTGPVREPAAEPSLPPVKPPPQATLPVPPPVPAREPDDILSPRSTDVRRDFGLFDDVRPPLGEPKPVQKPVSGVDALAQIPSIEPAPVASPAVRPARGPEEGGERDVAADTRPAQAVPSSAGVTPGGTRIIGPAESEPDTLKVPDTLKPSDAPGGKSAAKDPFDLSSLENIEAEFARLLGRIPGGKDKDKDKDK